MRFSHIFALAGPATAAIKGFNYGANNPDGSLRIYQDYYNQFTSAKNLAGTNGNFTSARLYTTKQGATTWPIEAIKAAIDTNTGLLLGLWASAGQQNINDEITALQAAISMFGTSFTSLVQGISVGSEDIYRASPLGTASLHQAGADPDTIVAYVNQVRSALAGGPLAAAPIGHVDTYNAYANGTYAAGLISALDFIGVDAYPYYESTKANSIDNSQSQFFGDYNDVVAVAQGKPVWITETGWPVAGPTSGQAVTGVPQAQEYWSQTGCSLFNGNINTWWFTLQDQPITGVSFGVVGAGNPPPTTPLYNLAC